MSTRPLLYLIDGSGYIFRAYYAIRPLSNREGTPTNAVFGFARMLFKLIRDRHPEHVGIAFDTEQPSFRHDLYADYKANREAPPEDLLPQFALIHELVDALDIPRLAVPGYEADDVLATLTMQAVARGFDVVVVSADKDLMQLVDEHVTMYDPMKDKEYDTREVMEKWGVAPALVPDVLALCGDSSDNIPGVPKVGPKSASKLVSELGDVEHVIAGLSIRSGRKAYEDSVVENAELARLSKRLTILRYDTPIQLDGPALAYTAPRQERLAPFLRRIDALGLMREAGLESKHEPPAAAPPPASRPPALTADLIAPSNAPHSASIDRTAYRTILELAQLEPVLASARTHSELSVDTETTSLEANRADLVGISLCAPGAPAVYIPLAHRYLGVPKQLPLREVLDYLRPTLEDPGVHKIGQNLKYDTVVLARAGVALRGVRHDALIAAYLLDPTRASLSLDALAREYLNHDTITYDTVTGTGRARVGFDEVTVERATEYAAEDADVALQLCRVLEPKLREHGQSELYHDLEIPLSAVLAQMERAGILVDTQALARLGTELAERLREVEARAHRAIGAPINLASPKQLAELLFGKLGYAPVKKTKTGYSTDQEVLEQLAQDHEIPRIVLEHRLLSKLKSTYVDALPKMVNPETGRVHTSFNQTGTATGRLSSSDPNLQNIPIRSDDGRRIREAFIAAPGCVLLAADYSQIELRVMAHLSGDPQFIEAFARGEDIHARTAQEILTNGAPPNAEARRRAKAINFGILYGLSEFGLARQLGIPRGEASAYIQAYFARYPSIRTFLDRTIEQARDRGFVTTLLGRRRYLPDLHSKNRNVRMAAERVAMNTPIQGTAADLIKVAMLRVAAALAKEHPASRLLLQVHDELVVEAPARDGDAVATLLAREMAGVATLAVPLVVDVGSGPSWASAH